MPQKRTFEKAMEDLEGVVRQLEGGSLTLDDSLGAFEKGIKLARECEEKLTEAKSKIEKLITDSQGNVKTEPFKVK